MKSQYFCLVLFMFAKWTTATKDESLGLISKDLQNQVLRRMEKLEKDNAHLRETVKEAVQTWTDAKQMIVDSIFLATISEYTIPSASGEVIVFDTVPINRGENYNTATGEYTATVHGYYQFSVNKEGNENSGTFFMLVNGQRYLLKNTYTESNLTPGGAITINIELAAGQVVSVMNQHSSEVYGINGYVFSWFTGYLCKACPFV